MLSTASLAVEARIHPGHCPRRAGTESAPRLNALIRNQPIEAVNNNKFNLALL